MGKFRDSVLSKCWLLGVMATPYFWVMAITTFPRSSNTTTSTSPTPAPTGSCSKTLPDTLETWIRWMVALIVSCFFIMLYLRTVVEGLAADEKDDILEEESYRVARDELREAIKSVDAAILHYSSASETTVVAYTNAIGRRNAALQKAARTKPRQGLARLPKGKQRKVRCFYIMAILCSFMAGFCAAAAYFLSMRLQYGCNHITALEIAPFVFLGSLSSAVHLHAVSVACTKD